MSNTERTAEAIEAALQRADAAGRAYHWGEAGGIAHDVLQVQPDNPLALGLLGIASLQAGDTQRSVELLERAASIQPEAYIWQANLSAAYRAQGRIDDAYAAGRKAVDLGPDVANNYINYALAMEDRGAWYDAQDMMLRAVGLDPNNVNARLGLAFNLLTLGEYWAGWREYVWVDKSVEDRVPPLQSAPWNGMEVGNLLLIADQGYGDALQFARFIPWAARRARHVFLAAEAPLARILGAVPGVEQVYTQWDEVPAHAAHARLSALPGLGNVTLGTLPWEPYLRPLASEVDAWCGRLGGRQAGVAAGRGDIPPGELRRVGLAWKGRQLHPWNAQRSLPLAALARLRDVPGTRFVSLQPTPLTAAEWEAFPELLDVSDQLTDFRATAALIANLDLVITLDSAQAHLAGGLGAPVWVMLPYRADWRWMLGRGDSPWYPSARLFRQTSWGDWDSVVDQVWNALRNPEGRPHIVWWNQRERDHAGPG